MEILPPEITGKPHPRDSEKGITGVRLLNEVLLPHGTHLPVIYRIYGGISFINCFLHLTDL